jgi:hypothetical protein
MVSRIVLLKSKVYPVKRGLEGCSPNENSFLEIQHLEHSKWFCVSDELLGSHLVNVFHC